MSKGVVGVILAGGRGARMGGAKALRPLAGRPLIAHVIDRLQPQVDALVVALAERDPAFAQFECPQVYDPEPERLGPASGIVAAMAWAREHWPGAAWVASSPCDTPLLPHDLVERLLAAARPDLDVVCASSLGQAHFTIALWRIALLDQLRTLRIETPRLEEIIGRLRSTQVAFADARADPFENVNTPDQLARVEIILRGARRVPK